MIQRDRPGAAAAQPALANPCPRPSRPAVTQRRATAEDAALFAGVSGHAWLRETRATGGLPTGDRQRRRGGPEILRRHQGWRAGRGPTIALRREAAPWRCTAPHLDDPGMGCRGQADSRGRRPLPAADGIWSCAAAAAEGAVSAYAQGIGDALNRNGSALPCPARTSCTGQIDRGHEASRGGNARNRLSHRRDRDPRAQQHFPSFAMCARSNAVGDTSTRPPAAWACRAHGSK
jgi:hypothetical protein